MFPLGIKRQSANVIHEVQAKRSIEPYVTDLASNSEVARETVSNINPSIAAWDLGRGESQVLALALGKPRTGVVPGQGPCLP
jgi:hypothetical protein